MTAQTISLESILIPEVRSNAVYTAEQYENIKQSIAASGVQFRPLCRYLPDGRIELVDGLHRMKAWKELGHVDIEVEIEQLDDMQAMTKHLTANHHRGEADPIGLGKVVKKMHEAGKSYEDIAKVLGYAASTVSKYETLLTLPDFVQEALTKGDIKIGHVQQFARLEDLNDIQAAMQFAIQMKWTVEALRYWVEARIAERNNPYQTPEMMEGSVLTPPPPSPELAQQRQCLCCGAYDQAQQTVFWQLCHGCADTLRYLKTVQKTPWEAVLLIQGQQEALVADIQEKEKHIKGLEAELVAYSRRILNAPGAAIPSWPKPASTGSGGFPPQQG